jgi:hypothetical protein
VVDAAQPEPDADATHAEDSSADFEAAAAVDEGRGLFLEQGAFMPRGNRVGPFS